MAAWKTIARFCGRFIETAGGWSLDRWKAFLVEYRLFFQSAEALFVGALWTGAVSAGADMTLWVPLLFLSWLLGTISIATANWGSTKKYGVGSAITLTMALTAVYIFVAHRPAEIAARPEPRRKPAITEIEPNTDPNAQGFFATALVRLYDTPELRRKYVFDFLAPTKSRISFYVSPSDLFVFSVTDVNNETYSLEVPIASNDIPLNRYVFLYCETALRGPTTLMRILVDGKQIAERTLEIHVELGKDYWKWEHATVGADTNGQNNAPFKVAMFASGHAPFTDEQLGRFQLRIKSFLATENSPVQFH